MRTNKLALCAQPHTVAAILIMKNLADYCSAALAKHEKRHAEADSILFNSAGFWFDRDIKRYVITVRECIVAEVRTIAEVKSFSAMHNNRLAE